MNNELDQLKIRLRNLDSDRHMIKNKIKAKQKETGLTWFDKVYRSRESKISEYIGLMSSILFFILFASLLFLSQPKILQVLAIIQSLVLGLVIIIYILLIVADLVNWIYKKVRYR